jgi:hypothetical protein
MVYVMTVMLTTLRNAPAKHATVLLPGDCRGAERDYEITDHGNGFASRQFVGVVARSHFGEARQSVAYAFDEAKSRCGDAHRSEECGH